MAFPSGRGEPMTEGPTTPEPPVAPEHPAATGTAADWRTWLMVGATGFGGPAGQVAILHSPPMPAS